MSQLPGKSTLYNWFEKDEPSTVEPLVPSEIHA